MSPLPLSAAFLQAQPDKRLVELASRGHAPAFEAIVRRYRHELLAYCRRLQPASSNAEDALQQTLLLAWRALSAGGTVREVRPWLYRIAHNVCMSGARRAVPDPDELHEAVEPLALDQLVEQRLAARAALREIAALPRLQRQVIVSAALCGASHEATASAMGISSASVRGLMYRARATLRAAAAAAIPGPIVSWAVRQAAARPARAAGPLEALTGGGGAGVAGLVIKGGVAVTVAGAIAGAGVVVPWTGPNHGRQLHARSGGPSRPAPAPLAMRARGSGAATAADPRTALVVSREAVAGFRTAAHAPARPGAAEDRRSRSRERSHGDDRRGSGAERTAGGEDGGVRGPGGTDGGGRIAGSSGDGSGSSGGSGRSGGSGGSGSGGSGSGGSESGDSGSGSGGSGSGGSGSGGSGSGGSGSGGSGSGGSGSGGSGSGG